MTSNIYRSVRRGNAAKETSYDETPESWICWLLPQKMFFTRTFPQATWAYHSCLPASSFIVIVAENKLSSEGGFKFALVLGSLFKRTLGITISPGSH